MSSNRREFLSLSAATVAATILGRPWPAHAAFWQEAAFTPIRRNVGSFTMRGGTIGWLVDPKAVVVVDSQFPAEGKTCLDGLNSRSGGRAVDFLINTHHHGDHTGGNVSFRGVAQHIVAQETAAAHMRNPPGGQPPADALFPDITFTERWNAAAGDERVHARYYGRAHTSGDAVITFERANVAHMGDLVFNQRHPVVDRAAGASLRSWIGVLERAVADHGKDTIFIFGHAKAGSPLTGANTDVLAFRDYLSALISFVEKQVKAGRSRQEVLALRDPLEGFESYGPFGQSSPREALTAAYDEITGS